MIIFCPPSVWILQIIVLVYIDANIVTFMNANT